MLNASLRRNFLWLLHRQLHRQLLGFGCERRHPPPLAMLPAFASHVVRIPLAPLAHILAAICALTLGQVLVQQWMARAVQGKLGTLPV